MPKPAPNPDRDRLSYVIDVFTGTDRGKPNTWFWIIHRNGGLCLGEGTQATQEAALRSAKTHLVMCLLPETRP